MDEKQFLNNYDDKKYEKPSVTADIVILSVFEEQAENYRKLPEKSLKLLMIKRGTPPYENRFALPGGFTRRQETVDKAAIRELEEETGVKCSFLQQLRTFSTPNRDPRGWVITCAYMALINGADYMIKGGDDAKEALWFDVSLTNTNNKLWKLKLQHEDEIIETDFICNDQFDVSEFSEWKQISSSSLAFDHALIIVSAITKLRKMINSGDNYIVFKLLPKYFSLSEVQQVYEVILNKKIYPQVFRRQIKDYVEETQEYTQSAGHRPSKLYSYKPSNF